MRTLGDLRLLCKKIELDRMLFGSETHAERELHDHLRKIGRAIQDEFGITSPAEFWVIDDGVKLGPKADNLVFELERWLESFQGNTEPVSQMVQEEGQEGRPSV